MKIKPETPKPESAKRYIERMYNLKNEYSVKLANFWDYETGEVSEWYVQRKLEIFRQYRTEREIEKQAPRLIKTRWGVLFA